MVDLRDKESDCDVIMNGKNSVDRCGSSSSDDGRLIKACVDCGTTKTPLWRGGPLGRKSLCNACGIKSRKRRRVLLGLTKVEKKQKKTTTGTTITSGGLTTNKSISISGFCSKRKLVGVGTEFVLQRPRSTIVKQRRKLGEVEEAALLLMALSCGSVYA